MRISRLTLACTLSLSALFICTQSQATVATKAAAKPAAKHKLKAKSAPAKPSDPDDAEPDTTGSTTTDFNCELGNKITIYTNDSDALHIALRWEKHVHRLTEVGTTTGAKRYENIKFGLVWIGIPAKGMLLDSKQHRQLANECKNAEQTKPAEALTSLMAPAAAVPATPVVIPVAAPAAVAPAAKN